MVCWPRCNVNVQRLSSFVHVLKQLMTHNDFNIST